MFALPVATELGSDDQQPSPPEAVIANAPAGPGRGASLTPFVSYDGSEPFDPLDDEQDSRPSTAQSSRSQTPLNTDLDDSAICLEQSFEKVSLREHFATLAHQGVLAPAQQRKLHINDLPLDVLHEILHHIRAPSDLLAFMQTQRRWFRLGVPRLWFRPAVSKKSAFELFCSVLAQPPSEQMHPYAQHVARLNFSPVCRDVTDEHVLALRHCVNLKRLILSRCRRVSSQVVQDVVACMPNMWMLDLDEVAIDDAFLACIARVCSDIQVFYADSDSFTDAGLAELTRLGPTLRRIRLKGCKQVTARGALDLVLACSNLVELDLAELDCLSGERSLDGITGFLDRDVQSILLNCEPLRILKISGSPYMTDSALNLRGMRPLPRVSNLRELHLSCSPLITDAGVLQITRTAPRIRLLNLSRCAQITDRSLDYIASAYGSNLEYLHIGHCMNISDRGVITIAEHCNRLWYFDAANCIKLTDLAIVRLTRLSHLRRIGIVKCANISDQSVLAISLGLTGVERLHLSYCTRITQYSITRLLEQCGNIVHLSLTGVASFMDENIRRMARVPPEDLSDHQRQMFCVFSQSGVSQLRKYLLDAEKAVAIPTPTAEPRNLMLGNMVDMPADQFDEDQLQEIDWLRQHELASVDTRRVQNQESSMWTNSMILPSRDGLVRFGPRDPSNQQDPSQAAGSDRAHDLHTNTLEELPVLPPFQLYYELTNRQVRPGLADERLLSEEDGAAVSRRQQPSAGHRRLFMGSELPSDNSADDEAAPMSIAAIRERRFRLRLRPRSAPPPPTESAEPPTGPPTGPLEGPAMPPQ